MALFSNKTEKTEEKATEKKVVKTATASSRASTGAEQRVLKSLRITEKSVIMSEGGAYTFEIDPRSGKKDVEKAVKAVYKVDPAKIHITRLPGKKVMRRTGKGRKSGVKKAVVYLKKGDKIEFV